MKTQESTQKFNLLYVIMVFFCMTPFVFPFPGLESDLQPYALFIGLIVILGYIQQMVPVFTKYTSLLWLLIPTLVAFIFLALDDFSTKAFRAAYNHFSVFIVTLAFCMLLQKTDFQEKPIKFVLWIWFAVAAMQMLYSKTFLASIISGTRENAYGRGVVGLSSESSFFGISCFYFLHLANYFKKKRMLYLVMVTFMAVVFAQSMQGILFVLIFYIGFILDNVRTRKGFLMVLGIVIGVFATFLLLQQIAPDSRLIELLNDFINEGFFSAVEGDVSASNRLESITSSIGKAFDNWLIPQGYDVRMGSGFGGFLVELGIFGLIETLVIAFCLSIHYKSVHTRVIYFILVYIVLFSNTQIGNPQLLIVLASNLFMNYQEKTNEITQSNY